MMISNNCCPYLTTYDPCCTININSTTYRGQKLRDHYSSSHCCDQDDMCVMNLTTCSNCTELCTNSYSTLTNYDPTVAMVKTSYTQFNNQPYLEINVTIIDISRKLSGLQFDYYTNAPIELASRDTHMVHINNGIYVAQSSVHQYFDIIHNPTSNIVAAVVSQQHYMSNEAILYAAISNNSSVFIIQNVIVTNDQFPTRKYTPDILSY